MAMYCSNLRRMIACINKIIQTPQINQCNNSWCLIDFNNVSKMTLEKQKNAFNYENKYGVVKGVNKDRLNCRINHMKFENDNYIKYKEYENVTKNFQIYPNEIQTLETKWKNVINILFDYRYENIDLFLI